MVALVPIVRAESEFALIQRMKEVDIYEVVRPPFKTDIISLVAHRALTANDVNAELFRGKEVLPSGNFTASFSVKVQLLQDLVNRKSGCGESVLMDDIYGFFPELRKSEIPGDRMVRDTDIEHGILLFIYDLQDRIWR
ncbi:hypothetical protein EBR96_06950 [bacterium]|nr:hypothetical protein [bacterium]